MKNSRETGRGNREKGNYSGQTSKDVLWLIGS